MSTCPLLRLPGSSRFPPCTTRFDRDGPGRARGQCRSFSVPGSSCWTFVRPSRPQSFSILLSIVQCAIVSKRIDNSKDDMDSITANNGCCSNGTGPADDPCCNTKPNVIQGGRRLLKWTQVPAHLKFNPYIHDGYRPLATLTGCIKSLAYFHNETVNILTHGLPVLYIIFWSPTLIPWDQIQVPILPYTHLAAVLSPWVGSAIYHTFMNHHHGYSIYRRLLQLDMLGIWVTQSFGALTGVIAATYCFPSCTGAVIVVLYCLTCLWGLYKAVMAGCSVNPWDRRLCFFLPVVIRLSLVILRSLRYASGHPDSLAHVWLQDAIAILGGIIGALRVPERCFPGRFDFFFNSHHIMHVLVLVAVVQMHYAAKLDLIWLTDPQCCSSDSLFASSSSSSSSFPTASVEL